MPFSFAHPLAVVPLARTALPFSALVIGSMSPDFHYLIHLKQSSHSTHTFGSLFTFCLPASLVMLGMWQGLLKRPLLELLPDRQQQFLHPISGPFRFGPSKRFALICFAILVGAATHLIWDSFTHLWGWPVQQIHFLRSIAIRTSFQEFPVYKLLQYASSILGTAIVAFLYWRWEKQQTATVPFQPRFPARVRMQIAMTLFVVAAMVAAVWSYRLFPPTESFYNFKAFVVRSIVVGTAVLGIELLVYAVWYCLKGRADSDPSD